MTTIRFITTAGVRAPRPRRIPRAKQARMFTAAYSVLLGFITALVIVAAADIVPAFAAGHIGARPVASSSLATALVIFLFVIPAVAALQLHVERTGGKR